MASPRATAWKLFRDGHLEFYKRAWGIPLAPEEQLTLPKFAAWGRIQQLRFEWAGGQAKPIVSIER